MLASSKTLAITGGRDAALLELPHHCIASVGTRLKYPRLSAGSSPRQSPATSAAPHTITPSGATATMRGVDDDAAKKWRRDVGLTSPFSNTRPALPRFLALLPLAAALAALKYASLPTCDR